MPTWSSALLLGSVCAGPCWNPWGELIPSRIWGGGGGRGDTTRSANIRSDSLKSYLGTVQLDSPRAKETGGRLLAGHRTNWNPQRNPRRMRTLSFFQRQCWADCSYNQQLSRQWREAGAGQECIGGWQWFSCCSPVLFRSSRSQSLKLWGLHG